LAARVVEVIADRGEKAAERYGTGPGASWPAARC
jgi:hypothetical protein